MNSKDFLRPDYDYEDVIIPGPSDDDPDEEGQIGDEQFNDSLRDLNLRSMSKSPFSLRGSEESSLPFTSSPTPPPSFVQDTRRNDSPWGSSNSVKSDSPWATGRQQQSQTYSQTSNIPWGSSSSGSLLGGKVNKQDYSPWIIPTSPLPIKGQEAVWDRENQLIVFCDFLDGIVETYESYGNPGLLPRDIYDIKPIFENWKKLAIINPIQIFLFLPINLLPDTNNSHGLGWSSMITYYQNCITSYLRIHPKFCNIVKYSGTANTKVNVMEGVIESWKLDKNRIMSLGYYSGLQGQSNRDYIFAKQCGIKHFDFNQIIL